MWRISIASRDDADGCPQIVLDDRSLSAAAGSEYAWPVWQRKRGGVLLQLEERAVALGAVKIEGVPSRAPPVRGVLFPC